MCEQDLFKNTGKYRANRCSVTPTRHRHPRNIWHAKYLDLSAIQNPAVWNDFWLKNTSAMTYSQWESKIQSGKFGEELSQDYTTGFWAGFCCRRQISTVCGKKTRIVTKSVLVAVLEARYVWADEQRDPNLSQAITDDTIFSNLSDIIAMQSRNVSDTMTSWN